MMNDNRTATPPAPCRNVTTGHEAQLPSPSAAQQEARPAEAAFTNVAPVDIGLRNLRGAEVRFGDGGAVTNVSLPSEFSAARFTGLPAGTMAASVRRLLLFDGIVSSPADIRQVTVGPGDTDSRGEATYTAEVVVWDPHFAGQAASRIFVTRDGGRDFVISAAAIPVPASQACHAVVERKVVVSWDRSICRAYLTYRDRRDARAVVEQFRSGRNRVLGCRVHVKCVRKEHPGFTVVLEQVLSEAGEADVYAAIPFDSWPERVEMGIPTYYGTPDSACRAVEMTLRRSGGLQRFERQATSASTQVKVEARFVDEAHARRAVAAVDDKLLPTEEVRMKAHLVASAEFKIDERVADTLHFQERLNTQTTLWDLELVGVLSRRRDGCLFLELQGPDSQAVARAKRWLERTLEGEVLREQTVFPTRQTAPVPGTADSDCAVCFTPAERAIQTSCGHVYCATCFAAACDPASLYPSASAITCLGDEGACCTAFPLAELRSLLPPAAVEGILAASFDRHIAKHPASLRYCPTPDCGHIYRPHQDLSIPGVPSRPPREHLCPGCLATFCTACHAAHPDMSCFDYRDVSSGRREAVDRLKAELGVKDCSKCGTSIEKTEGCNHVTCKGCGAHLCWLCLAVFSTGHECYDHLARDHGGIFDAGDVAEMMQAAGLHGGAPAGVEDGDDEADDDEEDDRGAPGEVLFRV